MSEEAAFLSAISKNPDDTARLVDAKTPRTAADLDAILRGDSLS